ncbi:MAG: hypothetical protein JWP03_61 [Phycisphaerales bacterium]|jgi:hypothetical protein|nr:hypothetical protein [Phycisphaerales bacterium]
MIRWAGQWRAFERDEGYFLRELQWEIELNSSHPLHGKECRIAGWIPGYDHFILFLEGDGRYVYVLLIWRRDEDNFLPYCKFLDDTDAVSRFVDKWTEAT